MIMNSNKAIFFYPDIPHERTVMSKICQALDYKCSNQLEGNYLLGFKWKDQTYHSLDGQVISFMNHVNIFNRNCVDISKKYIYQAYSLIFGNPLAVDPLVVSGSIVCKSNRNASHDGYILQGPITAIDPEKSYCMLIDNSDGIYVIDYRVPIFLDQIPIVYLKRREKANRFSNKNFSVSLVFPQEVFNTDEISKLLAFSREIGMQYGELDVLRDRNSQLIYIVDANNTPFGPPNGLSDKDSSYLLKLLCCSFEDTFISVSDNYQ